MFPASTRMGGMCFAFPDVCNVPAPPSPSPIPTPFPNQAQCEMALPFTCSIFVKIMNQPVLHKMSVIASSTGDEAGVALGVTSGMIKGPVQYTMASVLVKVEGMPVVTALMPTGHNGANANAPSGAQVVPSQFTVIVTA
jgi:hypothetical protein